MKKITIQEGKVNKLLHVKEAAHITIIRKPPKPKSRWKKLLLWLYQL